MRRLVSVLAVSIIVLTAFFVFYSAGDGCQGGCYTPCNGCYLTATAEAGVVKESSDNARLAGAFMLQDVGTPFPEDKCHLGPFPQPNTTPTLHEYAILATQVGDEPGSERPLCFFEVDLVGNGSRSTSRMFAGEATTFYVSQGEITFTNDDSKGATNGVVLVDPDHLTGNPDLPTDRDGTKRVKAGSAPVTLTQGGKVFLDNQCNRVDLIYENTGDGTAVLFISSAPKDELPEPEVDGILEDTPTC
jgi:hypothetical protein